MKTFFKSFTLVVALAAAIMLPARVEAQSISPASIDLSSALPLVGSTASNLNAVINCRYQSVIPLTITLQNNDAGTAAITFVFASSGDDGTTYATTKLTTLALPATGATSSTTYTNIATYGATAMKLLYVTNAAAGTISTTNAAFKYTITKGIAY